MDEFIQYPSENLQTAATTQGKILHDTWQAHLTHLNQQILQPASQLTGGAGDKFQQHMITWSQNLGAYYQALTTFTNLLKTGSIQMDTLDTNVGQTFEPLA